MATWLHGYMVMVKKNWVRFSVLGINKYKPFYSMETKFMTVESYGAYRISFALSNDVWNIIINWKYFEKDTVGKQFARAIDSISANIAEGFGRYFKRIKLTFTDMVKVLQLKVSTGIIKQLKED